MKGDLIMSKIDTYDLEKEQHELLRKEQYGQLDKGELIKAYINSSTKAIEYKKTLEAIDSSLNKNIDKDSLEKIHTDVKKLIDEYDFRYLSPEEMEMLEDYGYTDPIAPVLTLEAALEYMDNGYPVYLLHRDGTATVAQMGINIERHLNNDGLVGVTPFAKMDMNMKLIYGDLDIDKKE